MAHPQACLRFLVSGRVQGVAYRVSACSVARQLGLRGWVRNLADGRVELIAAGPAPALEKLEQWLHQGPPQARVEQVIREAAKAAEFEDFEIR
ncbi:MAG TPA: acylphosphatase [Acidiferrobacterales bacterium]|nr:acylphosphatase [Acidiferrobacterales bacterium]